MGPGCTVIFYRWQSLGEGISLSEAQDDTFALLGAIGWVGKQAYLNANPVSLGKGQQLITLAITK